MASTQLSIGKKMGEAVKAGCRWLCGPIAPILPSAVANRLPFLGRVCIHGPRDLRLHLHTYGPHGKDRIAVKLARRGLLGYEGETTRVFLPLVQQARVVVDIGANTGLFSLLAARANPNCSVFAFEPVPMVFDMLQANVRLNELTNLETIPYAISDHIGDTPFFVSNTHVGVPTDSSSCAGFRSNVKEIRVPMTTLDAFMAQRGLDRLDVLKIDAEATEAKVVRGAVATLKQHRPFVICEVLENVDHAFVESTFANLGYRFFHIGPGGLECRAQLTGSLMEDQRNYLLAPVEKIASVWKSLRLASAA